MANKSYISYKKIIREIKNLSGQYYIEISFNNIIFKSDFEKYLLNCIREEFYNDKICGRYFKII